MNVFETHKRIVDDYAKYIRSFINIADPEIRCKVDDELAAGKLWPDPLLQFNPAYQSAGDIKNVVKNASFHVEIADIFTGFSLYQHQLEAMKLGGADRDFVVTSGTGSGKSLTYIGTIFNHLLNRPTAKGVTAIIVYPMNALINSQTNEFNGYAENYARTTGRPFPITYGQYTGQEGEEARGALRESPPHVLLTNYMMLELLLTRIQERSIRDAIYANLKYLVFDELHTYRGRQGADIAMLIRRITAQRSQRVTCIGTSATMVSVGSAASQRQQVAEVASTIFGREFTSDQVIAETLTRSLKYVGRIADSNELERAVRKGIDPDHSEAALLAHPIANWLENTIAVEERALSLARRRPMTISAVVDALSTAANVERKAALKTLTDVLLWISKVNHAIRGRGDRYTVLPFKLHQFIAQTGSVYTTLDQGPDRFITLEPGLYKADDEHSKPIFPNVFSRATGHAFLCVSRLGDRLEPREFRSRNTDEGVVLTDGYLVLGDEVWNPAEDLDNLPDAWVKRNKAGELRAEKKYEPFFPRQIWFDEYGKCSDITPMKYSGWFMRAPLLFDPTGGVFFDPKTNEGTKLTQLGSEGRSTSTTITAVSILTQLAAANYPPRDQKLLSFTDNRQDAALQAGHFNDFLQVVQLRAAIHAALKAAPGNMLTYATIGAAVFDALRLPFLQYANSSSEPPIAVIRRGYEEAFQKYLFYRAVADLRRSWRIVLPNLEQCGLLTIEYEHLEDVSGEDVFWASDAILGKLAHADRAEFLATILDFCRLEFALYSENFLTPSRLKESEKEFREKLRAPWTLDREEQLREPYVLRLAPLKKGSKLFSKSAGSASALGKFLKQYVKQKDLDVDLRGDAYERYIHSLLERLSEAQYLTVQEARDEANHPTNVFRLRIDKVIWKLGDGETVKPDVIKRRAYKALNPRPNEFFREMYRRDFAPGKRLRAEDHTGQLGVDARRDREDRFRADWFLDPAKKQLDEAKIRNESISALFCSPTMELGVDIGGLSVVHLRNAPPNPANYAQRSGRAGRSGQGALIFTYCSSYSPHDRHYFKNQAELVAGEVQTPRIDLYNQELLRTHLNALAVSEIGLPGLEVQGGDRPSLMKLVDETPELPLKPGVREGLTLLPATYDRIRASFTRVVRDFAGQLQARAPWYSDTWIDQNLAKLGDQLDGSLVRWRALYRSARGLLTRVTQPIESGHLTVTSDEYRKYKRLQDQATRQLNLLRNDAGGSSDLSEFYPYRYLAAEGFLPGYNFTRLPLRIFVPSGDTSGEFISRPRHIALREFGPQNIIYHSGRKYRVSQMVMNDVDSSFTDAKISKKAGYFLIGDERDLEICPFSGLSLGDTANADIVHDLLDASEARAEEIDRISCEEEERISKGYDIQTFFAVDGGQRARMKKAVVKSTVSDLLNIRYIPAARLVHINKGWRATTFDGFPIGLTSGDWRSSMPDPAQTRETFRLVKLWTSNTADALYIEPVQPLGLDAAGVITLQYAIKRAIESVFQAEPNEIGAVAMGDKNAPNIFLYESAEGSLGILSQFVETPAVFYHVIDEARRICRFSDREYKAPASYDDLLSYYNQRDHKSIDRFRIEHALEKLAACKVNIVDHEQFGSYDEQYDWMIRNMDPNSSTERVFIKHIYEKGLRLPDSAQKRIDGIYCQPDFYYEPRIWIFCDGSPHDDPEVARRDQEQRQLIIARGDEVWSWHYRENLEAKVAQRPDIFRKVR
jgi:superfamily II DNA/RNA helicase